MKAFLVLENGDIYEGLSFGYESEDVGEVVFNTSMAGYQEILTDPSYNKQIVTLTYPMVGNYGISSLDMESDKIQVSGLIVKEYVPVPSNFTSEETLSDFLKRFKVPAIQGVDTRKLTRYIRNNGAPNGGIFVAEEYSDGFLEKIKSFPGIKGMGLADAVTTQARYDFGEHGKDKFKLAVYDYGVKLNILRNLDKAGFSVTVFPAKYPIQDVLAEGFDAFFLSNGPGDPEPLDYAIDTAKKIIETKKPLFGICLGHQVIGLALGNSTYKLKFGHRGGNQPVKNLKNGRVEITAQNHGFAVQEKNSQNPITHINLNDNTMEGIESNSLPIMAVQYHPESSPGPHDAEYLFSDFYEMVKNHWKSRQ
ncbi:MAG: glutamine-hydrolyzing carbamoyl-phosphate synthase small subunit [Leptospiraceae bacterium]|nr:glutamine-hydrolyzing carbamoyl-phosphate synthase small subunit [Leptospiraceae bacterium]MCP5493176.1 glutamine-hydrolyzing carbamoyl-phosphate synthase small subunit [Leptospiraceae bacterium]